MRTERSGLLLLWAALCLFFLTACAGLSPEARLKQGYDTVNAYARTNTVLLQRGTITKAQAQNAMAIATDTKATLDKALGELKACRAAEADAKAKGQPHPGCEVVGSQVMLAQGLLLQLEGFLESQVAKEAGK